MGVLLPDGSTSSAMYAAIASGDLNQVQSVIAGGTTTTPQTEAWQSETWQTETWQSETYQTDAWQPETWQTETYQTDPLETEAPVVTDPETIPESDQQTES